MDTDLGGYIGRIGDNSGEDVAGDSQSGLDGADFDGLTGLSGKDRDLEIEVNGIVVGCEYFGPVPGIDSILDAANLVDRYIVLGSGRIPVRKGLYGCLAREAISAELGEVSAGALKFQWDIEDIEYAIVIGIFPADLR